jgi:hypothetical protein
MRRRAIGAGRAQLGFSLVEVLVAGVVLVIGLIFIAQFFTSTAARILTSDTRSLMAQIATQQIETVRGLQYDDVGTVGGHPPGQLQPSENITVEGRTFRIQRSVTYYQDPSYSGPYPANYRRVTVKVSQIGNTVLAPVVMSTNVAGGTKGGTLDVTVTDVAGTGIPGVQLTISDSTLSPTVLLNAPSICTDDSGHLQVPGLTADTDGGYFVSADLDGYNSAAVKQALVVNNGTPYTVVQLIIDKLATMNLHLTDQNGTPLSGVALNVTGYLSVSPWTFNQNVTTNASGNVSLAGIRYSTSLEPYFVQLVTPHNPPLSLPTGVSTPTVDSSFLPLADGVIPVILTAGTTQTVNLVINTAPIVTGVSPTNGTSLGGTSVTITGLNFTGATAVKFGATNATSFTVNSNTSITAVAPAGTGTVDVRVTSPNGTSAVTTADQFTYNSPPAVTGLNPTSGTSTGGTSVTITGTGFTGATAVKFGATNATSFIVNSGTSITAVAPAGTGTVDVRVTTPYGTSAITSADQFTYFVLPTVTLVNPTVGPAAGGTSVTITGTSFTGATAVKFGATNATSFTVNSSTSITAVAPAGTGTVDIRVTTPTGTSVITSADQFTFYLLPTVTKLAPTSGTRYGGTSVVITGTNFTGATVVKFGTKNATSFVVNSATQITAVAPSGTNGTSVYVTVTTPGGTSVNSVKYTYN